MNPAPKGAATERPVEGDAAAGGVMSAPPAVLGPMPCISCGQSVRWIRIDGQWRLMQGGEKHRCAARAAA